MPRKERQTEIFNALQLTQSGVSQILSGTASAVVSSSIVASGRPVVVTPLGTTFINSGLNAHLGVNSIVTNTSFMVVTGESKNMVANVGFTWFVLK